MATLDNPVLVVRSITNAMRGQKLLEQYGITAYVQRNTSPSKGQGCGYALKIKGKTQTALGILAGAGIPVVEIQGG